MCSLDRPFFFDHDGKWVSTSRYAGDYPTLLVVCSVRYDYYVITIIHRWFPVTYFVFYVWNILKKTILNNRPANYEGQETTGTLTTEAPRTTEDTFTAETSNTHSSTADGTISKHSKEESRELLCYKNS